MNKTTQPTLQLETHPAHGQAGHRNNPRSGHLLHQAAGSLTSKMAATFGQRDYHWIHLVWMYSGGMPDWRRQRTLPD